MMKHKYKALALTLLLLLLAFLAPVIGEDKETTSEPTPTPIVLPTLVPVINGLRVGEKHVYEISWKNIAAGTGEITVVEKVKDKANIKPYVLVHMSATSSKLVSVFYKVEDLFVSQIDLATSASLRFEKHTREGKTFRDETVLYDYASKLVKYETVKKQGAEPKKKEFKIDGNMLDPLSAVLFLRNMDLKVGESVSLPIHSNEEPWVLKLDVVGLTGLRVPGIGKFNTYKLKPEVKEDALFAAKGAMTIWMEKNTKVVLRAEVDIPIGTVVIKMIRAEKSPLETVNRTEKRRRWVRPGTKDIP